MLATGQVKATRIVRLRVHGLGYGPAVEAIAMALAGIPGVESAKVAAAGSMAHVACRPEVSGAALLGALARLGFRADVLAG